MGLRSSCNGADESLTKRIVLTFTAYNNWQSYKHERPANHVSISTVARPNIINRSSTFVDSRDKPSIARCASSVEDEIEIDAEFYKRQNAAGQIG